MRFRFGVSDADLLAKSISDNKRDISQDTGPLQRAQAVKRLKDMENLTNGELGERLSVSKSTIRKWLEPFNWEEDTCIQPNIYGKEIGARAAFNPRDIPVRTMIAVRRAVGGGELGVKALKYAQEHDLPSSAVREAKGDNDYDFFVGLWNEANSRSDELIESSLSNHTVYDTHPGTEGCQKINLGEIYPSMGEIRPSNSVCGKVRSLKRLKGRRRNSV